MQANASYREVVRRVLADRLIPDGRSYSPHSLPRAVASAMRDHRTNARFDRLESLGLVRMEARPDEFADMGDLKGDSFNPSACLPMDGGMRRLRAQEKAFERMVARDGVYGIVGEYRLSDGDKWIHADSVWGFVGDDWRESGYAEDVKSQTIDALRKALSSRCPTCRKPH